MKFAEYTVQQQRKTIREIAANRHTAFEDLLSEIEISIPHRSNRRRLQRRTALLKEVTDTAVFSRPYGRIVLPLPS